MRTENDWKALERAEGPAAVARMKALEQGLPAPSAELDGALSTLLALAKEICAPTAFAKKVDQLAATLKSIQSERASLAREKREFEIAQDRAFDLHQNKIATELKAHNDAIAAGQAALEKARAEIEALKVAASADATKAAKLKATWQAKISAFERAS